MATTITKLDKLVGKRIRRREDPRLITGTATYVEDIRLPDMLHAVLVRSPHGAANIKSIDISKAAALPGVAAVFVGKDTEGVVCVISDRGTTYTDPLSGFTPAHGLDLSLGGMGLWLARKLWDHVDVLPSGTGLSVRLSSRLR
jgi:hypothetical protein